MTQDRKGWVAFGVLALILVLIGVFIVPAHCVSIWMDWEFTDWVSPIANKLSPQSRLYEDGLHSPMPPLPFILAHMIWPHGARWIDASLLYFLFQAALILLLFRAFSKRLGASNAFICALMVLPVYFSFGKTILYDSMAQLFVASCGITTAALANPRPACAQKCFSWRLWLAALFLGLQLGLLLLTKQNTCAGTVFGVCIVLLFRPQGEAFHRRLATISVVLCSAFVFFCLILLALSRWVSFSGLIHDVFLTGSEPKGGGALLAERLVKFGLRAGITIGGWSCVLIALYWVARRFLRTLDFRSILDGCISPRLANDTTGRFVRIILTTVILSASAFLVIYLFDKTQNGPVVLARLRQYALAILNLGLALAAFFAGGVFFRKLLPKNRDWGGQPLAACALIFFLSAMFHSLSVVSFRWSSDNNPLVFSTLSFVVCGSIGICENPALPRLFRFKTARIIGLGACMVLFWSVAAVQIPLLSDCTESWTEIRHLAYARLRPEAGGMRKLVKTVRSYCDPATHETALLLPNDPNIEAWFERDRPKLSSAIVFADQYWDRYVEDDLARLKTHPPKVIIFGPRNYWRGFSQLWKKNLGVERLMDSVQAGLLRENYDLVSEQQIDFRDGRDFMDIYVRRDKQGVAN